MPLLENLPFSREDRERTTGLPLYPRLVSLWHTPVFRASALQPGRTPVFACGGGGGQLKRLADLLPKRRRENVDLSSYVERERAKAWQFIRPARASESEREVNSSTARAQLAEERRKDYVYVYIEGVLLRTVKREGERRRKTEGVGEVEERERSYKFHPSTSSARPASARALYRWFINMTVAKYNNTYIRGGSRSGALYVYIYNKRGRVQRATEPSRGARTFAPSPRAHLTPRERERAHPTDVIRRPRRSSPLSYLSRGAARARWVATLFPIFFLFSRAALVSYIPAFPPFFTAACFVFPPLPAFPPSNIYLGYPHFSKVNCKFHFTSTLCVCLYNKEKFSLVIHYLFASFLKTWSNYYSLFKKWWMKSVVTIKRFWLVVFDLFNRLL